MKLNLVNLWTIGFVIFCNLLLTNALKCSEVEYCSALRSRTPADIYNVDASSFEINDVGIISFDLEAENSNLEVKIYSYKDDVLRVKIREFNSTRFELSDVFSEDPALTGIQSADSDNSQMTITTNTGSKIVIQIAPFNLEFYRDKILEMVLRGDTLFFDDLTTSESFSVGLVFPKSDYLYGLHQHATGLTLRYTNEEDPYRLFNLDNPNYPINDTHSVYGAVPALFSHGSDFTSGIFLHNAAQQFIDILPNDGQNMAYFMVEAGTLDLLVFLGPTPSDVLRQYLMITGVPHMPPIWALGYHQSRYSYMTQDEVKDVVANFDNFNFQMDAIWLDLDHTNGQRYFTWNLENFTDPLEMQTNLSATNRKLVVISDPHIKAEQGYSVYDGALENELFVRNSNGSVFEGTCWPGVSSYIDFLDPEARAYYSSLFYYENYAGTSPVLAGIWNDMNEPVVFDGPEAVMPGDCLQYGNAKHKELHNAYGMLQTKATHTGLLARDNRTTRPFVLSRSHFAGSQRYTAVWTGDSTSKWEYLAISYPMCLTANLVGIAFCGADVAGFNGNPDNELYQRWFQAGAWLPFFRVHSHQTTDRREPYLFPEDVQEVVRNAIQIKYQHLPVWYTLFHEHIAFKTPVIRPLFFQYPSDSNVSVIDDQLLVGSDIMVRAVTEPGVESVSVYFPGGEDEYWISIYTYEWFRGSWDYVDIPINITWIPVYYRVGSIIPRKDTVRRSTAEMYNDAYTLYVNIGSDKTAHGAIYLDDTTSFLYMDWVEYNYLSLDYVDGQVTLTKIDSHANSDQFDLVIDRIVLHEIVDESTNGESGKYIRKEYRSDFSGTLLRNLKLSFQLSSKLFIKLDSNTEVF